MKKIEFTILTNETDSNGSKVDLSGVELPNEVPISINFNHTPFGIAQINRSDVITGVASIPEELGQLYMCPALEIKEYEENENGQVIITKAKLLSMSLCFASLYPQAKRISEFDKNEK